MAIMEKGTILANTAIAEDLFYMQIALPLISSLAEPGSFISLLPPAESGRYLRKPFSVALAVNGTIGLVIKAAGPATRAFADLKTGSGIDVMGPLGNSYPDEIKSGKGRIWMIGGGTGIASLLFLQSVRKSRQKETGKDKLLWAGRKASMLPLEDSDFFDSSILFSTDDGSAGEAGSGADVFEKWLTMAEPDAVVSCGPPGLMKAVKQTALENSIPSWFSLEEFMACGIGACAGCAVKAQFPEGSYHKACSDGPVFRGDEVIL